MKKMFYIFVFVFCLFSVSSEALVAESRFFSSPSYLVAQKEKSVGRRRRELMMNQSQLNRALDLIKKRDYLEGVKQLFLLSQNPAFKKRRTEIRFVLGKTFMELKLFHAASFQFISAIETGDRQYVNKSLRNLTQIATALGDQKLLQFAIEKGGVKKLSGDYRDSLFYQYGKHQLKERRFKQAVSYLGRIKRYSPLYLKARYNLGLAYAEMNQTKRALSAFDNMLSKATYPTDPVRVAALIGKARVYYQAQKWNSSAYFYRQIPRDSPTWHDMIIEYSWALLRAGKFRTAMNGFHTLHSSYYTDRYQPEAFLLRAIIYMYICKYDEMEKVLKLFNTIYSPIKNWAMQTRGSVRKYYYPIVKAVEMKNSAIPRAIALRIFRENDFRLLHKYLSYLEEEKRLIQSFPTSWRYSKVGRYSLRVVDARIKTAMNQVNSIILSHLRSVRQEMRDFFNQEQYLKYEALRGKREMLKQKISKRSIEDVQIIKDKSRDYFVQNGFEFWPFNGEYWLDELGNYHYVGLQNCR